MNLNLIEIQTDITNYLQHFPEIQNPDQFPSMPHFQLSDGHHGKQLSASVMDQTSLHPFDVGEHHLFTLTEKMITWQDNLILEWPGSPMPLIKVQDILCQAVYIRI